MCNIEKGILDNIDLDTVFEILQQEMQEDLFFKYIPQKVAMFLKISILILKIIFFIWGNHNSYILSFFLVFYVIIIFYVLNIYYKLTLISSTMFFYRCIIKFK